MPATEPRGLFITGTGTAVGKTIFAAALAMHLRKSGVDVGVMKPLETGVADVTKAGEDGELLRWAAANGDSLETSCPYRFENAAAPATASRLEQQPVNYTDLVLDSKKLVEQHQFTLIEGAGGLMVPIAGGFLISDLARDIGLPMLVVADAQLGTINHSLLTLLAARYLEIEVVGYILNRMPTVPNVAEKAAPHDLASLTIEELLAVIPEVEANPREMVEQVAMLLPTLPSWPLLKKYLPPSA
jgi:dethiobiotin synthetase